MKNIINEIKRTLKQEKQTYSDGGETDDIIKGWIEGLEYVLRLLDDDIVEQIDHNSDEHYDKLNDIELDKLSERLNKIETEQKIAWGLHLISGGFVKAEFDDVDADKIHITITDGIQSDCENRVNTTHCSLWRDTLEYTD